MMSFPFLLEEHKSCKTNLDHPSQPVSLASRFHFEMLVNGFSWWCVAAHQIWCSYNSQNKIHTSYFLSHIIIVCWIQLVAVCCWTCSAGMAAVLQSGVCVIEAGCFNVYTSDGRDYVAALPFPVRIT